jgi:hypothetical protein
MTRLRGGIIDGVSKYRQEQQRTEQGNFVEDSCFDRLYPLKWKISSGEEGI